MPDIRTIKSRLDIDADFLQQAWRNIHHEENHPLQNIVNFCHQQPFYHDYTDHLINNGMEMKQAEIQTETLAMAMLNLLHNPELVAQTRQEIARSILMRLKFGLNMVGKAGEGYAQVHHNGLEISIPETAHEMIDLLIENTRNTVGQYNASKHEMDTQSIPDIS